MVHVEPDRPQQQIAAKLKSGYTALNGKAGLEPDNLADKPFALALRYDVAPALHATLDEASRRAFRLSLALASSAVTSFTSCSFG